MDILFDEMLKISIGCGWKNSLSLLRIGDMHLASYSSFRDFKPAELVNLTPSSDTGCSIVYSASCLRFGGRLHVTVIIKVQDSHSTDNLTTLLKFCRISLVSFHQSCTCATRLTYRPM